MKKETRNLIAIAIIAIGVAVMTYIWISYGKNPVAGASVPKQNESNEILLDGNVVADHIADLGFVLPAKIKTITKNIGDEVRAGEIIATEENTDIKAQVSAAKAGAQVAEATLNQLRDSLKVQKLKLKDLDGNDKKIQKAEVAGVQDNMEAQQNSIAASQANLANIQAQLTKTILIAPFDGVITRQDGEVGEVSGPSAQPFLTIESKGPYKKIESYATDLDALKIKVGDSAKVKFDTLNDGQIYLAHVSSVDLTPQKNGTATYKITFLLDQPNSNLRSGMHTSISLGQ